MGLTAYVAAMTQRIWLTEDLASRIWLVEIWIIALLVAMAIGAAIGAIQGGLVAYIGIPSFIVHPGRSPDSGAVSIFKIQQGQDDRRPWIKTSPSSGGKSLQRKRRLEPAAARSGFSGRPG